MKRKFLCKLSRIHHADPVFQVPLVLKNTLPPVLSYRGQTSAPWDQGETGSCTGHASGKVLQLRRALEGLPAQPHRPSPFFLYANARLVEGTIDQDAGASIRDVGQQASLRGFCGDDIWATDPSNPTNLLRAPSPEAYKAATPEIGLQFSWLPGSGASLTHAIKVSLITKNPVLFGITVYESFESDRVAATGFVPLPGQSEQILGGHALAIVGWNDHMNGGAFEIANSWGSTWGDRGYAWLKYEYVENPSLAQDFGAMLKVK